MTTGQVVAGLIGVIITALATVATQRAAAKAAVKSATLTSRTDLEREAFERAKGFYTDTIDRQAAEIRDLDGDVTRLKSRVAELERDLEIAKTTLKLRFPDE